MSDLTNLILTERVCGEDEDIFSPPSIREPGRILFDIYHIYREAEPRTPFEIEVLDYDGGTSIFWLMEGMGVDYFLTDIACIELDDTGFYVIEGVNGHWIRGDGWTTDDDEEWDFGIIRRASPEEIASGALS